MERTKISKIKHFLIFALPGVFVFCAVEILPLVYGFYLTLTDWNGIGKAKNFVGAANYIVAFRDAAFWESMGMTFKFAFFTVILTNLFGFFLAYVLTRGIKGQEAFRVGFFTPNLIGGVLLGIIWNIVFSNILPTLGKSMGWKLFSTSWLSDPKRAFWALVIVTVWQFSGYMMLIYVAGLSSLSSDVLEAASVDGASGWDLLRSIVLPLMVPSFVICTFLTLIRAFATYDVNLALTSGGPYGSTRMIAMYIYEKAFKSMKYSIGQSQAVIMAAVVFIFGGLQVYLGKKREVEA